MDYFEEIEEIREKFSNRQPKISFKEERLQYSEEVKRQEREDIEDLELCQNLLTRHEKGLSFIDPKRLFEEEAKLQTVPEEREDLENTTKLHLSRRQQEIELEKTQLLPPINF